jgi:phosphoribosylformylglycinamidine (FGAM) synthase-like enzyme
LPTRRTPPTRFEKTAGLAEHRVEELGLSPVRLHGARRLGRLPGSDAAVLRIKGDSLPVMSAAGQTDAPVPDKYIAMTVDGNGGYVYLDPYEGAKIVVAEACRNLACSGAVPLGATDNLNMPSPLKPELFWQIKESVRGLADACKAFNAPVTGGNCSLYNQIPTARLTPRRRSPSWASSKSRSTSPRNGSRTKAT